MSSAQEDPVYKSGAAADYVGVHVNTLRWWRRHDRGPICEQRGSHHVYRKSALDDFNARGDAVRAEAGAA
jgi:hypothetical protein